MRKILLLLATAVALAAPIPALASFIYELDGAFQPDIEPFDVTHFHFVFTSPGGAVPHDVPLNVAAASLDLCVSTFTCVRIVFNDIVGNSFDELAFITTGVSTNFVFGDGAFDSPGVYLAFGNSLNSGSGTLTVTEVTSASEPASVALLSLAVAMLPIVRRKR